MQGLSICASSCCVAGGNMELSGSYWREVSRELRGDDAAILDSR